MTLRCPFQLPFHGVFKASLCLQSFFVLCFGKGLMTYLPPSLAVHDPADCGCRLPGWIHSTGSGNGGAGIGHAETQLTRLWSDKNSLAAEEARRRLQQVLETYTDVTRFPWYILFHN